MASKLPTSVTLVAATATPVTVDGVYSELQVSVHPGGATVWARGDGTASSTVGSNDGSYPVFPSPDEGTCIPVSGGSLRFGYHDLPDFHRHPHGDHPALQLRRLKRNPAHDWNRWPHHVHFRPPGPRL
jgi:hypothetical protein